MKSDDGLLLQTNIMFIASVIGGLGNFLFQILMNRSLDPADFAAFSSLLGLFMIVSVPGTTIQMVIAKEVSQYKAKDDYETIAGIFFRSLSWSALFAGLVLTAFMTTSHSLANFLNISSRGPIIITGVALGAAFFSPVTFGMLQGLQRFTAWAVNGILCTLAKILAGVLLVFFAFRVVGAMGSYIIAYAISFGLALIPLRFLFSHIDRKRNIDFKQMYIYSLPVLVATFFLSLLVFVDIIIVKHFFNESMAADYFTASIIARTIIYLPGAVSMVMFPKVIEVKAKKERTDLLLKKSLAYSFVICSIASLFFFFFSEFVVSIFRPAYSLTVPPLLKLFGLALIPLGMTTIMVYYNLALQKMRFIYVLVSGALFHIILLSIFRTSLFQIISVLGLSGIAILMVMGAFTLKSYSGRY